METLCIVMLVLAEVCFLAATIKYVRMFNRINRDHDGLTKKRAIGSIVAVICGSVIAVIMKAITVYGGGADWFPEEQPLAIMIMFWSFWSVIAFMLLPVVIALVVKLVNWIQE